MRPSLCNYLLIALWAAGLTACGGGSGSTKPDTSPVSSQAASTSTSSPSSSLASSEASSATNSSALSTVSTSSTTNTSSTSSASSSASNLSSSSSSLPSHASNGTVYCTEAGTDSDGDGWGWENNASCLVRNSAADPDRGNFQGCIVGTSSFVYCATDNGNWGYESGHICMSQSFCPANRSADDQTALADQLVDSAATSTTQTVYDYLRSIWGTKTLAGQMDLTWNDSVDEKARVYADTGKYPALMGFDFMQYTRSDLGSGLNQTTEAKNFWDQGGLVAFNWHWRDPSHTTDAFYSADTSFKIPVANGQLDMSSTDMQSIDADIDTIASELKSLQDQGVAVLWRPLHEASGGWFWWGRARTDGVPPAYAEVLLWRHIYERMTNHHGLHNLIWVWNGQSAAWYPGDSYVDIVGTDIYDGAQNYESQIATYNTTKGFPLHTKLVALTENSNIPSPDNIASDGAWWLWFMVWNDSTSTAGVTDKDNFWTGEYYNTNAHKVEVYNHVNVITLDELPSFIP